jgi:23S rRNA pseudouridine955/2504/2580 synthase
MGREYFAGLGVGHRLDKETSGVLALTKNPAAYRHLSMQFEHRETEKIYHALVVGQPDFHETRVNMPLAQARDGKTMISHDGKPAETWFSNEKVFRSATLVSCMPVSGRLHQIRVHLKYLNFPIVGDKLYGGPDLKLSQLKRKYKGAQFEEEQPLMKRTALHAFRLSFELLNNDPLTVEAPYPKDLKATLQQLEKWNSY